MVRTGRPRPALPSKNQEADQGVGQQTWASAPPIVESLLPAAYWGSDGGFLFHLKELLELRLRQRDGDIHRRARGVDGKCLRQVGHLRILLRLRSEEYTSELQSPMYLVCRLL